MVNFNNEATIGTPAINIVKTLLLEARANALEYLEQYNKKICQGVQADQSILKARLGTWFMEHQAYLERTFKSDADKEEFNIILTQLFFNENDLEKEELLRIVIFLNNVIDKLRITRIDLRKQYDRTNVEEDNLANDLT